MLSVCIGAFKVREYAEAALKEAKEKGFKDAYLIPNFYIFYQNQKNSLQSPQAVIYQ
ncbi:hypothetical protein [Paraclostridium bifermentans]|uniref:hypothetical protein n=1 Tax=Paraclostridium bifermentans TaxID=1490 RepID=UPI0022E3D13F|nr:hypothetical protein [Paraclostridium bifermentans]